VLLSASNIVFSYEERRTKNEERRTTLRGVSITCAPGDFVGILGPNGSGKTTLLRALGGLIRPASGVVTLDDVPLWKLGRAAAARRIAVVPQEIHPAFDYSVLEMVLMGRYPHLGRFSLESPRDFEIARAALASTGTLELEDRQFSTLSGGEKQRVVIASALAQIEGQARSCLLLDEPTASLDLGYQLEVASVVQELAEERRIGLVLSTHDLNLAAGLCRTLVVLKAGEVIASGPTADVLTPALIRRLYGVESEIAPHPRTGRLLVVPISRAASALRATAPKEGP
jgi:iron complex transport system ATP-binding protein